METEAVLNAASLLGVARHELGIFASAKGASCEYELSNHWFYCIRYLTHLTSGWPFHQVTWQALCVFVSTVRMPGRTVAKVASSRASGYVKHAGPSNRNA